MQQVKRAWRWGEGTASERGNLDLGMAALDGNGDGKADLVTGVGPSQRPEVKVFDAVTLGVNDDFFADDASFLGGVIVGAGR